MQTLERQEFIWADSQSSSQRAASPDHQHRTMLNIALHSRGHTNKKKGEVRWLAKQWSNCGRNVQRL